MADTEEADLLGLGEHCDLPHCATLDFLPFRCDCCHKTFCLDHHGYAAHGCPNAAGKSTEVIVCPLCAKGVRLGPGQEPNSAFHAHQTSG